jgi:hypothetical protein
MRKENSLEYYLRYLSLICNAKILNSDVMIHSHGVKREKFCRKILMMTGCLLFAAINFVSGQHISEQKPPLRERMFFGGSLGMQFGTYTDIQVTPIVGLWIRPRIAVAAGPSFRYYKDPYYETTMYGGNAYMQFVPIQDMGIFLQLEDDLLNFEDPNFDNGRVTVNTVLGGFGIRQQLGSRSFLNLIFLWAFNDTVYHLYSNPEIRLSFSF